MHLLLEGGGSPAARGHKVTGAENSRHVPRLRVFGAQCFPANHVTTARGTPTHELPIYDRDTGGFSGVRADVASMPSIAGIQLQLAGLEVLRPLGCASYPSAVDNSSVEPNQAPPADDNGRDRRSTRPRSFWREIPILILVALVLSFFLQTFIARVYLIPSASMEPTLHGCPGCTGDRIVVEKISFHIRAPRPGDVVVFRGPSQSWNSDFTSTRSSNPLLRAVQDVGSLVGVVAPDENDLVKRVIATGGQKVECCDAQGRVMVDDKPLTEPYIKMDFPFQPGSLTCESAIISGRCFPAVTVPEDNIWAMGDNRSNSKDSRAHVTDEHHGTVPIESVIGRAIAIVLPPSRWGTIDSPQIQQ